MVGDAIVQGIRDGIYACTVLLIGVPLVATIVSFFV